MRLTDVLGEARRNLQSGVGRSSILVVLLVGLAVVTVLVPQLALTHANARAMAFQDSGAATLIVQAEGSVDGAQCETFGALPNVTAAGAVREQREGARLSLLPSTTVRYFEASPQFAAVLNATQTGAGVLLSDEVADATGWNPGDALLIDGHGRTPAAGTFSYPDDGRVAGFAFSLIGEVPATLDLFDECWITIWPQNQEIESLASIVVDSDDAATSTTGPTLIQANSSLGARFTAENEEMIWNYAGVAGAFLAAATMIFHIRGRRLELASAQHVGVRRADQFAIMISETILISLAALIVISPAAVYLSSVIPSIADSLGWHAVRGASMFLAGTTAGTVIGLLGIRERHLFRYFRER